MTISSPSHIQREVEMGRKSTLSDDTIYDMKEAKADAEIDTSETPNPGQPRPVVRGKGPPTIFPSTSPEDVDESHRSNTVNSKKIEETQVPVNETPEDVTTGNKTETANDIEDPEKRAAPGAHFQDQTNLLPPGQIVVVFMGLSACVMLSFLEQTIVSTALPSISDYFSSGRTSTWVATAYLLTTTACQASWGRFSDIFGRKVVLLIALFIFLIGSLACALAQTMNQLIAFRAIQGVGGGAMLTLVLIIVGDVVSLRSRGKYQGITEGIIAVSNGIGPVLGGVFSHSIGWRWCFWINLPLGGVAILLIVFLLPLRRVKGNVKQKLKDIDYMGTVLTLLGSVLLLLPLNWGGVFYPWSSPQVLTLLIISLFVFAAFVLWEWKGARIAIVPMYIFKNRTIVGVFIATFFNGVIYYDLLYYLPQFFQISRGFSAIKSGLLILPLLVMITCSVLASGQYTAFTGRYRPPIYIGFVLYTVGLGLMSTISTHTSIGRILGYSILTASAGGTFQTTLVAAQAAAHRKDMAVVVSSRNFIRSLGSVVGLAIGSAIINNTLRSAASQRGLPNDVLQQVLDSPTKISSGLLPPDDKAALIHGYTEGFQHCFLFCTICSIVAFVASLALIQHYELIRKEDEELKRESKAWLASKKAKRKSEGGAEATVADPEKQAKDNKEDDEKENEKEKVAEPRVNDDSKGEKKSIEIFENGDIKDGSDTEEKEDGMVNAKDDIDIGDKEKDEIVEAKN